VVSWKHASTHRRQAAASKANRRPAAAALLATGGSWWKSPDRTWRGDYWDRLTQGQFMAQAECGAQ